MAADLYFAMFYEFAVGGSGLLLTIPLLRRHNQRRTPVTRYLLLSTIFLLCSALISAISRILRITGVWEVAPNQFLELLVFTVIFVAISDVFVLAFGLEVFYEGATKGRNKTALLIYVALVGVFAYYAISTGLFDVDLNDIIWLFVIVLSVVVYIILIRSALKLARKLEDPVAKRGMHLIAAGPACLMVTFGLFMADSFLGANFTPLYYVAWLFALAFVVLTYLGVVQPDWLKKRISRKSS